MKKCKFMMLFLMILLVPGMLLTSCKSDKKENTECTNEILDEGTIVAADAEIYIYKLGYDLPVETYLRATVIQYPEYFEVIYSDKFYYYSNSMFGFAISKNIGMV